MVAPYRFHRWTPMPVRQYGPNIAAILWMIYDQRWKIYDENIELKMSVDSNYTKYNIFTYLNVAIASVGLLRRERVTKNSANLRAKYDLPVPLGPHKINRRCSVNRLIYRCTILRGIRLSNAKQPTPCKQIYNDFTLPII